MKDLNTDKLGEYEIIDEIGRGGMGVVYHAISDTQDEVAIKVCGVGTEEGLRRFKREVRAISKIHHDNVMPIIFEDLENDPPYYVMPLAKESVNDILDELVKDHKRALEIFLQICYGIQAAHLVGECHRDIKPQNALIMQDRRIVVSDFGLVKFFERDSTLLTKTEMWIGTEMYMAPEQFLPGGSRDANIRTDIYQLGKTLYQLYTGQYPAILSSDGIPANLWYIIQKATKQEPNERFSEVSELIDAINDYIASLDPSSNPQETFLIELRNVNDQLAAGMYNKEHVNRLIGILMLEEETGTAFLNLFDKFPEKLLALYAKEYADLLLPLIQKYSSVVYNNVASKSFDYAEVVASKMQIIYTSSENDELKAEALKSILLAAVILNRFRAMNTFNKIMVAIKKDDEAFVVAKMLGKNLKEYACVFSQIGREQLNPHIQQQWDKALAYKQSRGDINGGQPNRSRAKRNYEARCQ